MFELCYIIAVAGNPIWVVINEISERGLRVVSIMAVTGLVELDKRASLLFYYYRNSRGVKKYF